MVLSIITINYNNYKGLQRTIQSIVKQQCKDFEYIIVDGGSTDGSVNIIKENENYITKWVSEPDGGIYNAINKGARLASGEYCLYINAGDELYEKDTVKNILSQELTADFIEGRIQYLDSRGGFSTPEKNITLMYFYKGANNCHQASIIRRSMILDHPYDESYKIAADKKFNIENIIVRKCSFKTIDTIIAKYEGGGVSWTINHDNELKRMFEELIPETILKDYENVYLLYRFPLKQIWPVLKKLGKFGLKLRNIIKRK